MFKLMAVFSLSGFNRKLDKEGRLFDLILKLLETYLGLRIGLLHIPVLILADDISILSSTKSGMQTLLNVVNNYVTSWKLKYNATDLEFRLGEIKIPDKKSVIKPEHSLTQS